MPRDKYVSISMTVEAKRLLDEIKSVIGTDRYEELFKRILLKLKGTEEEEECRKGILKILETFNIKIGKDGTVKVTRQRGTPIGMYLDVECKLVKEDAIIKKYLGLRRHELLIDYDTRTLKMLGDSHRPLHRYMLVKIIYGYKISIEKENITRINELARKLRQEYYQHVLMNLNDLKACLENLGYIVIIVKGPVRLVVTDIDKED